jgi:hypothetical protein
LPEGVELIGKMKALGGGTMLRKPPKTPARELIAAHREWIEEKLQDSQMTAKQVWRLLREEKGIRTGYCTVKRYLRAEFQFGSPPVTGVKYFSLPTTIIIPDSPLPSLSHAG